MRRRHRVVALAAARLGVATIAALLLSSLAARAALDTPDSVFFGNVELEGQPAPVGTTISAWLGEDMLARYVLGEDPAAGDNYILRIPVAQSTSTGEERNGFSFENDIVAVFIDDRFSAALRVAPGAVTERDLTDGPLEIPDLVLWLDATQLGDLADDSPVALWQDGSGNDQHASQATAASQPRFVRTGEANHPAVRFDGNDFLTNSTFASLAAASQATAFVVRRANTTNAIATSFGTNAHGVRGEVHFDESWAFAGGSSYGSAPFTSTDWHLWASIFNGSQTGNANRLRQFINGIQSTLQFPGANVPAALPNGPGYSAGRPHNVTTSSWAGDIAEIMVYGRALDETERRRIESYVAHKYAIDEIPLLNQPTPTPTPSAPNDAEFVSQSGVPSQMTTGQQVAVSVTMRNTGFNTWTRAASYKLGANPRGSLNWSIGRVLLGTTDSIPTGGEKVFSFNITAPTTPGTYTFQWEMVQEGVAWFGDKSQALQISVASEAFAYTPTATPTATPQPVLDPPVPLNPFGTMNSPNQILTWTTVDGAEVYAFDVVDDTTSAPLYAGQTTATSFQLPQALEESHSYRWRVRAMDFRGWSAWSGWLTFDIDTGTSNALTPQPLSPSGVTGDTTPAFLWRPVAGALEYSLVVHDANLGSDVMATVSSVPNGETIELLDPHHSYRWRVRARTADGWGEYSPWQSFSIAPCLGDCDLDGQVSIGELVRSVNVALGSASIAQCGAGDSNGNGALDISELIVAVRNALSGCD